MSQPLPPQEDPALEQVRAIFREEGRDLINRLEESLLKLEGSNGNQREELVRAMRRDAHNLKGAAGSIGLKATSELAHALEDVLDRHRELIGNKEAFDVLHRAVDALEGTLADRRMPEKGAGALAELRRLMSEVDTSPPKVPETQAPAPPQPGEASAPTQDEDWLRIPLPRVSELMLQAGEASQRLQATRDRTAELRATFRELGAALSTLSRELPAAADLPALANVVAVQRNLSNALNWFEFEGLRDALMVDSLHSSIRSLRLRPLSSVFRLLPRMARDLSRSLGKEATLTVSGGGIEVERNILDMLRDALVHLVRNAMDHGIENVTERTAAGKPPVGRVHVAAQLHGNNLWVEVSDDGRGIDAWKVRQAAMAAQLLHEAEADLLPESAIHELIFEPGLSTKVRADEISGRGVGLDAVRTQVKRARGSLRLTSTPGVGTTFVIQVPILTHRSHVLLLKLGGDRVALPTSAVWKVLRMSRHARAEVSGQQVVEVEGTVVPIVPLAPLVFSETTRLPAEATLVVLRTPDRALACAVDELLLDEEVVVREVDPPMETPPVLTGVAVRSNGEVICLLNPAELVKAAGVRVVAPEETPIPESARHARRVLIVDDSFTVRALEKSILELAGYEVLVASDGEEALGMLSRERVDLVVSDINMPRRDGFELLSAVRSHQTLRQLPFILVTSRGSEVDRRRGLDLGASAYVVKSEFDQETLIDAVARLVD